MAVRPVTGVNGRAFAIVLSALAAGVLGQAMLLVAVNVLVLTRTHSAPAVAGLWIVPQVALLGLGSVMGRYTDRWDKRRTLSLTNLVSGAVVLLLVVTPNVWVTYGVFGAFRSWAAYFRRRSGGTSDSWCRLVSARANAAQGAFQYGAFVLGPALAGALLVHGRPKTVVWCVGAALVLSGSLLFLAPVLVVPADTEAGSASRPSYSDDLLMVGRFLKARPVAAGVIACSGLALVFGAAADAQDVVFAHRALHLAASGYGLLVSTAGVGYRAGGGLSWAVAARVPIRWPVGLGSVGAALGYLLYPLSPDFLTAAVGLVVLGIGQATANTGYGTFVQGALPAVAMGRITATLRSLFSGLIILATLAGGFMVAKDGVRVWMVTATTIMVLVGLAMAVICLAPGGLLEFKRATAS